MPARLATAAVVILAVGLTAVVGMRLVDRSNGPYPEYLSLRGPEDFYPEICDFYEPGHAASPTECRPPIPETAEPSRSVFATRYPVPSPSASPSPRDIDAELIALQLRRILVRDGHEVWWRTHDYISVSDGPC